MAKHSMNFGIGAAAGGGRPATVLLGGGGTEEAVSAIATHGTRTGACVLIDRGLEVGDRIGVVFHGPGDITGRWNGGVRWCLRRGPGRFLIGVHFEAGTVAA